MVQATVMVILCLERAMQLSLYCFSPFSAFSAGIFPLQRFSPCRVENNASIA